MILRTGSRDDVGSLYYDTTVNLVKFTPIVIPIFFNNQLKAMASTLNTYFEMATGTNSYQQEKSYQTPVSERTAVPDAVTNEKTKFKWNTNPKMASQVVQESQTTQSVKGNQTMQSAKDISYTNFMTPNPKTVNPAAAKWTKPMGWGTIIAIMLALYILLGKSSKKIFGKM